MVFGRGLVFQMMRLRTIITEASRCNELSSESCTKLDRYLGTNLAARLLPSAPGAHSHSKGLPISIVDVNAAGAEHEPQTFSRPKEHGIAFGAPRRARGAPALRQGAATRAAAGGVQDPCRTKGGDGVLAGQAKDDARGCGRQRREPSHKRGILGEAMAEHRDGGGIHQ